MLPYIIPFIAFFAVPPDPLVIFDETGKRRASVVGPYLVGDSIHLVCDAFGGKPCGTKKRLNK